MGCINFSEKKIFKSLIEKTKLQTIRVVKDNEPRFNVGNILKAYWNQRSAESIFCKKCSTPLRKIILSNTKCDFCGSSDFINKFLGEIEITSVRIIFIKKTLNKTRNTSDDFKYSIKMNRNPMSFAEIERLAIADGFESSYDFFSFFDNHYDLRESKMFAIYNFKWL